MLFCLLYWMLLLMIIGYDSRILIPTEFLAMVLFAMTARPSIPMSLSIIKFFSIIAPPSCLLMPIEQPYITLLEMLTTVGPSYLMPILETPPPSMMLFEITGRSPPILIPPIIELWSIFGELL